MTYSYDEWMSRQKKSTATKKDFKVGYFNSLKSDGDYAIIRFAYDSINDLQVTNVHVVEIDGKWKKIVCLRGLYDSEDKCPICASNKFQKAKSRAFLKIVEYKKDENGNVVASPVTMELPAAALSGLISEYASATNPAEGGDYNPEELLSNMVFKITRNGLTAKETRYSFKALKPAIFGESVYKKDFSAFEDLDFAHHSYIARTYGELAEFVETNKLPEPVKKQTEVKEERLVSAAVTSAAETEANSTFSDRPRVVRTF